MRPVSPRLRSEDDGVCVHLGEPGAAQTDLQGPSPTPPAHTSKFTLTRFHTRVGIGPPCLGQLGAPLPQATSDSHPPCRQAAGLGTTQAFFQPLGLQHTSLVFPLGASPPR